MKIKELLKAFEDLEEKNYITIEIYKFSENTNMKITNVFNAAIAIVRLNDLITKLKNTYDIPDELIETLEKDEDED